MIIKSTQFAIIIFERDTETKTGRPEDVVDLVFRHLATKARVTWHILPHWLLSFEEKYDFCMVSYISDIEGHPRQYCRLSIWFHVQKKLSSNPCGFFQIWVRNPTKAVSPPLPQRRPFVSPAGNLMRNGTHECGFFHIWLRPVTICISHLHQS